MRLSPDLRQQLALSYAADFGRELTDDEADALGNSLLDVLGPAVVARLSTDPAGEQLTSPKTNGSLKS